MADMLVTEYRFEKGIDVIKLELNITKINISHIGSFLKWINQDIIKENSAMIAANNFDLKEVLKQVTNLSRNWFLKQYY